MNHPDSISAAGSEHKGDTVAVGAQDVGFEKGDRDVVVDPVWGVQDEGEDVVHYASLSWPKACVILLKTQIALGVLGMPSVLLTLGGVPGTLVIFVVGLITTWTGLIIGQFKLNHPDVYSLSDAGYLMFGNIGREVCTVMYAGFQVCITGAALVPVAIAFNTFTSHATCTVVWYVIAAIIMFCLASIQTLSRISWITWIGFTSIMASILTLTIAVGTQERPASAPQDGDWDKGIAAFTGASFFGAVGAISTAIFGCAGTPMFFHTISEMKNPRHFPRALLLCQFIVISTYITIGVVVWYFCGQYLSNPALGSAGYTMKKVTYGIALPGLFVSGILYIHFAGKLIFVRMLRKSVHLTAHTRTHWVAWLSTTAICTTIGFILAESIPFFGSLTVLFGALFGTALCMHIPAWMWLHDNWSLRHTKTNLSFRALCALNWFLIVAGIFMQITGTISGVKSIIHEYDIGTVSSPFSCADNSG